MKNEYNNPEYDELIAELKMMLKTKRNQLNEIDDQFPKIKRIIEQNWND